MHFEVNKREFRPEVPLSSNGRPMITPEFLQKQCESLGQYTTPHLNGSLYLSALGIEKIENLSAYYGVRALYLDSNSISKIEGLSMLTDIRCLFLQSNHIKIIEGLENLINLETLELGGNKIKEIPSPYIPSSPEFTSSSIPQQINSSINELSNNVITESGDSSLPKLSNTSTPQPLNSPLIELSDIATPQAINSLPAKLPNHSSSEPVSTSNPQPQTISIAQVNSNSNPEVCNSSTCELVQNSTSYSLKEPLLQIFPIPLSLTKIGLSGNHISSISSLEGLKSLPGLSSLDLSSNRIDGEEDELFDLLDSLSALKLLKLSNNPIVSKIKDYRKKVISRMTSLNFLDEKPVNIEERRRAEAWARGGIPAENAELALIKKEKEEQHKRYIQSVIDAREAAKQRRAAKGGQSPETLARNSHPPQQTEPQPSPIVRARENREVERVERPLGPLREAETEASENWSGVGADRGNAVGAELEASDRGSTFVGEGPGIGEIREILERFEFDFGKASQELFSRGMASSEEQLRKIWTEHEHAKQIGWLELLD